MIIDGFAGAGYSPVYDIAVPRMTIEWIIDGDGFRNSRAMDAADIVREEFLALKNVFREFRELCETNGITPMILYISGGCADLRQVLYKNQWRKLAGTTEPPDRFEQQ